MYRDVRISNFRNIESLSLSGLSRINLITGPNGAGKTALLEALFLNANACNTPSINTVTSQRGEPLPLATAVMNDRPLRSLFHNLLPAVPINIAAIWEDDNGTSADRNLSISALPSTLLQSGITRAGTNLSGISMQFETLGAKIGGNIQYVAQLSPLPLIALGAAGLPQLDPTGAVPQRPTFHRLQFDARPNGVIPTYFISSFLRDPANFTYTSLTNAVKERQISEIIKFVRLIDQRANNLIPLHENGQNIIYVDVGAQDLIPLTLMGNGFANALHLGCAVFYSGCKVFFIDEMEDGIYYLAFKEIAAAVIRLCQTADLQMFITTHSGELAWAFAAAAEEANFTDISMLRFASGTNGVSAVTFDANDLKNSLHSGLDLR